MKKFRLMLYPITALLLGLGLYAFQWRSSELFRERTQRSLESFTATLSSQGAPSAQVQAMRSFGQGLSEDVESYVSGMYVALLCTLLPIILGPFLRPSGDGRISDG